MHARVICRIPPGGRVAVVFFSCERFRAGQSWASPTYHVDPASELGGDSCGRGCWSGDTLRLSTGRISRWFIFPVFQDDGSARVGPIARGIRRHWRCRDTCGLLPKGFAIWRRVFGPHRSPLLLSPSARERVPFWTLPLAPHRSPTQLSGFLLSPGRPRLGAGQEALPILPAVHLVRTRPARNRDPPCRALAADP